MGYITLHSSAKESKSFWTVWNHDRLLLYLSELPFKSYKWLLLKETVSKAYSYTSVNFIASFFVFIAITSASAEILRLWRLAWQLLWRCIRKRREQVTLRWKCLPKLLMKYALWLRKETPKRWKKTRLREIYLYIYKSHTEDGLSKMAWCLVAVFLSLKWSLVDWAVVNIKAVKNAFAYEFSWGSLTWTAGVCR